MINVQIIEWKKTAIYLRWIFIICFIASLTIIALDDRANDFVQSFGLILTIPTIASLAILTFMNKSVTVGNMTFEKEFISVEIGENKYTLDYNSIDKVRINNYAGEQFFSIKSIYPFYDGLNNYLWFNAPTKPDKIEIRISNKKTYNNLKRHLEDSRTTLDMKLDWKIK